MKTLLIRAEDKNKWERRSTIVPADLKQIIKQTGVTAYIESSEKRYFSEQAFAEAGAKPCIGMESGDVIFGVKEIPEEKIIEHKTYLFFSHTIKGQKENMPMLKRLMDSGSTLIDYEKITDEQGRRKVFFGPFAGDAGTIDIL
jgi:alpha-aminoadipic semialdehyde synthase